LHGQPVVHPVNDFQERISVAPLRRLNNLKKLVLSTFDLMTKDLANLFTSKLKYSLRAFELHDCGFGMDKFVFNAIATNGHMLKRLVILNCYVALDKRLLSDLLHNCSSLEYLELSVFTVDSLQILCDNRHALSKMDYCRIYLTADEALNLPLPPVESVKQLLPECVVGDSPLSFSEPCLDIYFGSEKLMPFDVKYYIEEERENQRSTEVLSDVSDVSDAEEEEIHDFWTRKRTITDADLVASHTHHNPYKRAARLNFLNFELLNQFDS